MEAAVRGEGNRRLATTAALAVAAALGCAGFALASGDDARWPALPAFLLAALVGIARTTTA